MAAQMSNSKVELHYFVLILFRLCL